MNITSVKSWIYTILAFNFVVNADIASETLLAELELADMELVDACDDLSSAHRSGILLGEFYDKILADRAYGNLLKQDSKNFKQYDSVPQEVQRNYSYLVRPGDYLLYEDDWNTLISYQNVNEEMEDITKIPCSNSSDGCLFTKGEYQYILKTSRDVDLLNSSWFSWQHVFSTTSDKYSKVLNLVKKAAVLNEHDDVTSYWEYLNNFSGAYEKAKEFWEEIRPLYFKLHKFVRTRLNRVYKLNETEHIPVFLLGNNFGNDWSYIADIILPHPQLHYDVETFLKYKTLPEVYRLAENLTSEISLGALGEKFWSNSRFNMSYCQPHIFSFCSQDYSEVYDCAESSWTTYLNAHETAFKVALRNQDYVSLMRTNLRYSGIDEAVAALGPLLAIKSIHHHGVETVDDPSDESVKMTELLLTALKFLPQLPYYLAADDWRLQELSSPSENPGVSWWKMREQYQGIKSVSGAEHDFLRDTFITGNKPYISKFFGVILAFQLLTTQQQQMDPTSNIINEFRNNPYFESMLRERSIEDWPYLVTLNYGADLSAANLLEYFQPLEQYLEEAPLEQAAIVTTTTTTTTTTTSPTTTLKTKEKLQSTEDRSLQGDQPLKPTSTQSTTSVDSPQVDTSNVTMYVGVSLVVLVACLCLSIFGFVYIKKQRRKASARNRRFES